MALVVDFDSNPRNIFVETGSTVDIRFINKSTTTGGVINSWLWEYKESAGAWTAFTNSTVENPIQTFPAGTYDIRLTCNDSGGTGATTGTKTTWMKVGTGTFTPPAQTTAYRNISIFVYEQSLEAAPKATCICRNKTPSCNLFYQDLKVEGAITKSGKTTFVIVNSGRATAAEIDLFESTTIGRYKNVAIIAGYDVIWSGKITKSIKSLKSQPGTTPQKATYTCEAYSDIKKLADWNIVTPAAMTDTPGNILISILAINSGEPDFIGTKGGYIDRAGASLEMTLADTDKYTAFTSLTNATDYDWRTRMETMLFQYAAFNGTNQITITSAGLTIDALIGQWILFPTNNYLVSSVSTVNRLGVIAWGIITDNTATVITATITGASSVPLATDTCLIVNIPRLDFSSDLAEPTPVRAFTHNTNVFQFTDLDEKLDLFTKSIAKGKVTVKGVEKTTAMSIVAKDAWENERMQFDNSTHITEKTETAVVWHNYASGYFILPGTGYAFQIGDHFYAIVRLTDGTINAIIYEVAAYDEFPNGLPVSWSIANVTTGTICSIVTSAAPYEAEEMTPDTGMVIGAKLYVKDKAALAQAGTYTTLNVGAEPTIRQYKNALSGVDPVYGDYLELEAATDFTKASIYPHKPGCLVSNNTYTEAVPQALSPIAVHGIITKTNTIDTITSAPDLEVSMTQALLQSSNYYQKSTALLSYYQFTVNRVRDGVQLTGPAMIREGQRISIVPYTGASAIERQVIIWDLDATSMRVTLTLGDYIKDTFNAINNATSATQKTLI